MGVVDMTNPPTKDLFASPALSLSLAGIFRDAGATATEAASLEVEEGDEGSGGGGEGVVSGNKKDDTVEISSENSGPGRSRSEDDLLDHNDDDADKTQKKKRKKYHRHTADQIREMEALFKESPHPDEKQRQQLSKQLGLDPRQSICILLIIFAGVNGVANLQAIQERHENSLLKQEMEKLREENKAMRKTINKACCINCGMATTAKDGSITAEENAKLKAEVEKLRRVIGKYPLGASMTGSCSAENDQENRSSLDFYTGIFGLEKSRIMEIVNQAMKELQKMATAGEPLWVRSVETGREILNYDEYVKVFSVENSSNERPKRSIEASRETVVVFVDLPRLVQSFTDANQWKDMFPCIISKAATVDVICHGEAPNKNGQSYEVLVKTFAEQQMLSPLVPTREVYFVRFCKQLSAEEWAVVDVSIDKVEENIDASLVKCRKRRSGCIIQDKSNGRCKVIWVEHLECQKSTVHTLHRTIFSSGLAFGARHWMATLQHQCERFVFFMATNVPTKDSTGVATLAGRKSILKLAQRMTWSFCHAIGASSYRNRNKVTSKTGKDIRVSSRNNLNDPGEPLGVIVCAVSSVWLPVSLTILFDLLRDESRRNEWDIMSTGGPMQSLANLAKGKDRGNATMKSKENSMLVLQDSCTNAFESMVVFAPVDITGIQLVITGCNSSNMAILPSGFSILPDGLESRPLVITSRHKKSNDTEGGSLLTIAFQILTNSSPTAKLNMESVESVNTIISCSLRNIKTSMQCEDG
ncbi:Homeobox-leucine zipper protein GLABRA 2 [Hibiscus syriacus]|uniref:Homeobox-leucine zipper protein GLABRA 2 n=1 Tax=Hibiscus syriacus TaxID=106335 RepID=A0A6A3DA60_HIBSY|nr:Homeobox-leucine zipper protein GLABRA 2 [Hibiscus syriacus]